ncbi:MAG: hypothetical protein WBE34_21020 [Candidatus Nitrosopolaris sp.]|jgi:hypothetical protein
MVFGQLFNTSDKGLFKGTNGTIGSFDIAKLANDQPDLMLTIGMAFKYTQSVGKIVKIPLTPMRHPSW